MNLDAPRTALGAYVARLMVTAAVWRKTETPDGAGGVTVAWVQQPDTAVQLVAPSASERDTAAQEGVEITHTAVVPVDSLLVRGDRLVVSNVTVELVSDPLTATHSAVARATAKQEHFDEPID